MSNQIKLTIDVSDQLLDKLLTVMALSSATPQMGGMPMQLMALAGAKPENTKEKPPIGFGRQDNVEEETEQDTEGT
jgi:hypothetical protein